MRGSSGTEKTSLCQTRNRESPPRGSQTLGPCTRPGWAHRSPGWVILLCQNTAALKQEDPKAGEGSKAYPARKRLTPAEAKKPICWDAASHIGCNRSSCPHAHEPLRSLPKLDCAVAMQVLRRGGLYGTARRSTPTKWTVWPSFALKPRRPQTKPKPRPRRKRRLSGRSQRIIRDRSTPLGVALTLSSGSRSD